MSKIHVTTRQRVLYEVQQIWRNGFRCFDTETTGKEPEDQIVQWAICSQDGDILGSGFIKPTVPISTKALELHGISAEMLDEAPSFSEAWPTIEKLLTGQTVVIYNASFDLRMLWSSAKPYGIDIPYDFVKSECAMELFARFYGELHEYWESYTWQKLTTAISELAIDVSGQTHHAEHDAIATAMIIKKLADLADQELAPGWHPPVNVLCSGCRKVVQECAEADEVWYCLHCSMELGLFHQCSACRRIVEVPATGMACDDLCTYCHDALHQEKMLLTGVWHYCPDSSRYYSHIVHTSDPDEPCENCQRQREWRRKQEEAERERQARIEKERKERKRENAKAYRQRRRDREHENQRRAEQGLPPLEEAKKAPVDEVFAHHGHLFQRQKYDDGSYGLYCSKCDASWSNKLPGGNCAEIKTYRSWIMIPKHLKTRTQLLKLRLKPAKGQKAVAVVDGSFDRYPLYEQSICVPVERKHHVFGEK